MKTLFFLLLAVLFLALAAPPSARGISLEDQDMLVLVADAGSGGPPAGNVRPSAPGAPSPSGAFQGGYGSGYGRWGGYGGEYGRWGGMASYLNLTKDQIARMRDIWSRYYLDTRDLRFDLMQKRLEMHKLFTDPKVDAATLMAKEKELMSIRDRLMTRRAQAMIDCRGVLTPEQIQKLDLMVMAHRRMPMGAGMGPGSMMSGSMMSGSMMSGSMMSGSMMSGSMMEPG